MQTCAKVILQGVLFAFIFMLMALVVLSVFYSAEVIWSMGWAVAAVVLPQLFYAWRCSRLSVKEAPLWVRRFYQEQCCRWLIALTGLVAMLCCVPLNVGVFLLGYGIMQVLVWFFSFGSSLRVKSAS